MAERLAGACVTHFGGSEIAFGGSVEDSIRVRWVLDRMDRLFPGTGMPKLSFHFLLHLSEFVEAVEGITEIPKLLTLPKGVREKVLTNEAAWPLLKNRVTHAAAGLGKSQETGMENFTSVTSTEAGEVRTYRVLPDAVELVGLTRKFQLELKSFPGTSVGDSLFIAVAQLLLGQVRQMLFLYADGVLWWL